MKGEIDLLVATGNEDGKTEKDFALKNNAPVRLYISKLNTLIDNAEDLDIVMRMYNQLECSNNYSISSGSLQNCIRDGMGDVDVSDNALDGKSFEYKTKLVGETVKRLP